MLGNDQSPLAGQSAISSIPVRNARHGRSSSTTSFTASLTAYAATVPSPVSTVPVTPRTSRRRIAVHHIATSSMPRSTRVPSVAASSAGPNHDGAPAVAPMTARYPDTETPSVTCTAPARPNPPGESQATVAATAAKTPNAANNRPAPLEARVTRFMGSTVETKAAGNPSRTASAHPRRSSGLTTPQTTPALTSLTPGRAGPFPVVQPVAASNKQAATARGSRLHRSAGTPRSCRTPIRKQPEPASELSECR